MVVSGHSMPISKTCRRPIATNGVSSLMADSRHRGAVGIDLTVAVADHCHRSVAEKRCSGVADQVGGFVPAVDTRPPRRWSTRVIHRVTRRGGGAPSRKFSGKSVALSNLVT